MFKKENFEIWNKIKQSKDQKKSQKKIYFHQREIWWCSLGKNIGFEQDGKGAEFTRPVLIIKRMSLDTCIIVPLTTSTNRKNSLDIGIIEGEKKSFALVEQIRLIDAKRLGLKIASVDKNIFQELIIFIQKIIFPTF